MKNEIIILANTLHTELKDLPKRIPKDAARYHFFLYKHTHEGDYLESIGMGKIPYMKCYWFVSNTSVILRQRERHIIRVDSFECLTSHCSHKFQSHLVAKLISEESLHLGSSELFLWIMNTHRSVIVKK